MPPAAATTALAAAATTGFRYPTPHFPGRCRQAQSSPGEKVPPRRPKRRPRPRASAIQRRPRGRYLPLLSFRLGQRPVIHRAHPRAVSSKPLPPLGISLACRTGVGRFVTEFGSSYESLVTEATGPARLFKGPRNKNRTRYGTRISTTAWAATPPLMVRSERPLRAPHPLACRLRPTK